MKARGGRAILVCALAAMALPASAAAKPGYEVSPDLHYAEAQTKGSNGYRLLISGSSDDATVIASKGTSQVLYFSFKGGLRRDRMRFRLPGVGRVDLRFHERSRSRENPADNCKGPGALVRRGIFRGRIKIAGEQGYTHVDVRSARGELFDEPKQICRREGRGQGSATAEERLLRASVPRGSGTLEFFAIDFDFGPLSVVFSARLWRQRGRMLVVNSVSAFSKNSESIALEKPPLSGSVAPPPPFTGTADFQREPGGSFSWLGDLAADLPGVGPMSLAGPHFEAEACVNQTCKGSAELKFRPR